MDDGNMYCYRLLAGAIISRAVEDMVDLLIFIRDIRSPDNEDLVYRRADRSYKVYCRLLAQHEKPKRTARHEIVELRKRIKDCEFIIENHNKAMDEMVFPDIKSLPTAEERSLARIAKKEMEKEIERRKKSIAKNEDKIAKANERVDYLLYRVDLLKDEEKYYLKLSSNIVQRKYLLNKARTEIASIKSWLHSEQFIRLNACQGFDPEALIEKSYKAVWKGLEHPSNKYKPYFLRRDNDD